MNVHKNAPFTPQGRLRMVRRARTGVSARQVAREFGVAPQTVLKWLTRYQTAGRRGLVDRSSRPHQPHPRQLTSVQVKRIKTLRKRRWTAERIARELGISASTVSRYLRRFGMNRLDRLERPAPVRRYERATPGSLLHMDIKKLGRFTMPGHRTTRDRQRGRSRAVGWEFVHICIDDHSRVAYAEIHPDERKETAIVFFARAVAYFRDLGMTIEQLMTDNGSCYRSTLFAHHLNAMHFRHLFTKPYTPRTNGKAERFIQTALREWAYGAQYLTSHQRAKALNPWLHDYNWHRPHASLGHRPPISRMPLNVHNLVRLHS